MTKIMSIEFKFFGNFVNYSDGYTIKINPQKVC